MPDLSKLAGLVWDILRDYFFAIGNAKIRPESASNLGLDKIRAFQISAVVLVAIIAAAIQTMLRADSYKFDVLVFLVIALVYFSVAGAIHSFFLSSWKIIKTNDTVTHDALTVVIGFNLLAETLLLIILFVLQGFVSLRANYMLAMSCTGAVLVTALVACIRSDRDIGFVRVGILILLLSLTSWLFLRYVVLIGL
jgi:small-conductance mechanosensitive channel